MHHDDRAVTPGRGSRLATTYAPLPVRAATAEGVWVTDDAGCRFLDMLSAYSAMNFGHGHPALLAAAREQLEAMTLVSRAFDHTGLERYAAAVTELAGKDLMVPMNTGAEAVETALKVARKWAYEVKGVPQGRAEVIVASGNFHGRTTTIVGFSDDPDARGGFGPFAPGFVTVPYGDAAALEAAVTADTAAVLLEPVQGEAGVVIPDAGYLPAVRRVCDEHDVLLLADEIQSGLGRTGATFACDHVGVTPDVYILGKALGGGIVPASAVVGDREVLGVLRPGQHGSTFGGNPLACRVGTAVVGLLRTGEYQERARRLGAQLREELAPLLGHGLEEVRVIGLWAGVDVDPSLATGREVCEALARRGVLAKDTHGSTVRLSPPLVIEPDELSWGVEQLADVLRSLAGPGPAQG
ncbi:ornithine--oxo-acid transaminase [Phycicoccus endophyticus]|uniref:ornithine--oxo-acid transaminase n=1 Tax=Phycicoccus endophyticus TaxID=1690220 RepID=UPI0019ACF640|nr:ornithine--oxo-acid transaminase [Phycicoccus endophyticus]GGL42696.1 ornithine--oxo-acid transaminase [Phycicoccus endophyticus]